ncbi:lipid A-modifier LpxR family protein [Celeribacter marinus]|uniref:lipid A-modifier LpxR family protein n=1 Tax=Celeribacter marinus TaxID=1397108 RepID=UPI003F6B5F6E
MFLNDAIGDGDDRWRSGSFTYSRLYGPEWLGRAPSNFGDLLEFRFRSDVITPDAPGRPIEGDRPYLGAVSVGMHSYVERESTQMRLGLDAVLVGPQTGLGDLQESFHHLLNIPAPDVTNQLGNAAYASISFEAAQTFEVGSGSIRPFVEAQVGPETLARLGVDYVFGDVGQSGLMLRDPVTGLLYNGIESATRDESTSFILGADVAVVADSQFLPKRDGYEVQDARTRLRAGLYTTVGRAKIFYGAAWLSPEFAAQPEGQVVGALNVSFEF